MDFQVEWIKNSVGICAHIDEYEEDIRIEFFKNLENQYNAFSEEEKSKVKRIFDSQFENEDLIYIYSIFIGYMNIDRFESEVIDYILQMDTDCLISCMFELQVIAKTKGNYVKKRMLHKHNIDKYKELLDINYQYIPVEKRNKKRIVIMTEQVLSELHAPTRILLRYAYILQKHMGYQVMIFTCPSNSNNLEDLWYQPTIMINVPEFTKNKMLISYKDTVFNGYQIDMSANCLKEYSMMFDLIYEWNPMMVLSIGVVNPVIDLAKEFTTVVTQKLAIGLPVSESQILIELDKDEEHEVERAYAEKKGQIIYKAKKIQSNFEEPKRIHTREEYNLPEDKFLIAIVGNRLDEEVDLEFIKVMQKIIKTTGNCAFVVVGDINKLKNKFELYDLNASVYCIGFSNDLAGVYKILNAYINPKRNGGGFSSGMALMAGLPVVTLPNCDVAYNVGDEFVVNNYNEMIDELGKLASDREYYQNKQSIAEKFRISHSKDNATEGLEERIKDIISMIEEECK